MVTGYMVIVYSARATTSTMKAAVCGCGTVSVGCVRLSISNRQILVLECASQYTRQMFY